MATTNELHVIFGAGPLGKWTARELVAAGKQVRIINRSGNISDVPASVERLQGDAYDVQQVIKLTQGASAIYQCAQPPYNQWPEKFPAMQKAILEGAIVSGAKLIVVENLYMYGDSAGKPLTEETPYRTHTRKGTVRQQMSEELMAAHRSGKIRVAIARGSNFFGPDEEIMNELVFYPALEGKRVSLLGKTDLPHTFTYAPDFSKVLAILGTHDEGLGQIWHVPSVAPISQTQLIATIEQQIGKPVKVLRASTPMVRLLGLFNPMIRESVEMMYEWNKPFVMDSSKFTRTFGMEATPLTEAVRATVEWCRTHPKQEHAA